MLDARRREFMTLLGGAAVAPLARPLAAGAQPAGKVPTIGFVGASTPAGQAHMVAALMQAEGARHHHPAAAARSRHRGD